MELKWNFWEGWGTTQWNAGGREMVIFWNKTVGVTGTDGGLYSCGAIYLEIRIPKTIKSSF